MDDEEVPTASLGVWVGLIVMTVVSFWSQATVTEERFVPALNVIADYYNIPDDIAGATLMAAGASSPELFSSLVALFVTHSALGIGTIVGSEIFNQLIICAGAVYASKTGKLQLDRAIVTREVGFYALAIALLYYALQDTRPLESDPDGPDHIFISFHEACLVFSGYIAYVIVCANMDAIVGFFTHRTIKDTLYGEHDVTYGAIGRSFKKTIDVPTMPFVTEKKSLCQEPAANWNSVEYYLPLHSTTETPAASFDEGGNGQSFRSDSETSSLLSSSIRGSLHASMRAMGISEDLLHMVTRSERPDEMHSIHDLELNAFESRMSCFLWQRSFFYTKAYFGQRAWHLRWFTITPENITSIPNRHHPENHRMTYPRFREIEIDEEHLLLKIINPNPEKRDYTLMAPSKAVFTQIVQAFELYMDAHTSERPAPDRTTDSTHTEASTDFDDSDEHVDLIEFPSDGSNIEIALWLFLFPVRFLMHYTIYDVRQTDRNGDPMSTIGYAYLAALSCLVWLIVGSYAMVASLEKLAGLMDVPIALVGVTVSAAGTSLPNYIASKVAAQNGFGNQAVSNAFGSNTFNIMVGLGLPWAMYTSFGTNFETYSGLTDDGITQSILILASVLLVFVALLLQSGFVLYKWHGNLFVTLYLAFIGFSIAQVFL